MTTQVLARLPADLARRLRRCVAPSGRSALVRRLLKQALPAGGGDYTLASERRDVDVVVADGLAGALSGRG